MQLLKETEDKRGKILWLSAGSKEIHIVETKKAFSRGGHYHPYDSVHLLISGQILYKECRLEDGQESSKVIKSIEMIFTPLNTAHLISAIEDSVFIEIFDQPYKATDFSQYRKIVNDSLK